MDKKQKILLFGGLISLLIISILSSTFLFKMSGNGVQKEFQTETEENLNTEINDKIDNDDSLTEEEKEALKEESLEDKGNNVLGQEFINYQDAVKLGDENKKEYPKEKTDELYKQLINMAQKADYLNITKTVEEELKTYKFYEDYNWKIGNVYYDSTIMLGVLTAPVEGQGHMVKNMKDPIMLTIGTLMIPERSRRDVIINEESLSPIFEGAVKILNYSEAPDDDKYVNEIYDNAGSVKTILKIDFTVSIDVSVEDIPLHAYVYITDSGKPSLFKITADEDVQHPFRTISYWKQVLK